VFTKTDEAIYVSSLDEFSETTKEEASSSVDIQFSASSKTVTKQSPTPQSLRQQINRYIGKNLILVTAAMISIVVMFSSVGLHLKIKSQIRKAEQRTQVFNARF
jgi:hypothetical protein